MSKSFNPIPLWEDGLLGSFFLFWRRCRTVERCQLKKPYDLLNLRFTAFVYDTWPGEATLNLQPFWSPFFSSVEQRGCKHIAMKIKMYVIWMCTHVYLYATWYIGMLRWNVKGDDFSWHFPPKTCMAFSTATRLHPSRSCEDSDSNSPPKLALDRLVLVDTCEINSGKLSFDPQDQNPTTCPQKVFSSIFHGSFPLFVWWRYGKSHGLGSFIGCIIVFLILIVLTAFKSI